MEYQHKSKTVEKYYHALNLTTEEYSTLQKIFADVIKREHPFTAFIDESRETKPTHLGLSNYYYNVDFVIAEEDIVIPV